MSKAKEELEPVKRFTDRYKDAEGNPPKCEDCGEPYDWPGKCPKCLVADWVKKGKLEDPETGKRVAQPKKGAN